MWLYLVAGDHAARPDADRTQACQSARHAAASSPRQCTRRAELPRVHLHRALVHEDLREELVRQVVMRMLIRRRYVRRVARMIVGVRSGMVLMLGLRRERLGRRRRCPRPVVRPVAFIGAIHLQGRISSTRPEESLPPSTHGDTKDSDIDMMATLVAGRIGDTLDFHTCFYLHGRSVSLLRSSFLACRSVPKILSNRSSLVSLAVSSERYFRTANSHVAMFAQATRRNGCVRMRHCARRRENATKHMYARGRDSSFVRPRLVSCRVRTVSFHFHVLTFSVCRTFQQRRVFFKPPPSATQLTLVERRPFFSLFTRPYVSRSTTKLPSLVDRRRFDDQVESGRTRTERTLDTCCVGRSSPVFSEFAN